MLEFQIPVINMTLLYAQILLDFVHADLVRVELQITRNCTTTAGNKGEVLQVSDKNLFSGVLTGASLFVQCLTSLSCLKK